MGLFGGKPGEDSPEQRGNTPTESAADEQATKVDVEELSDKVRETIEEYSQLYPKNKVFYVTSDGNVFLKTGYNEAVFHQRTLSTGQVQEVERIG